MKGVRASITDLMAVVGLAAIDCLALRWFCVRGSRSILLVNGLLPLIDLLSIGLMIGLRGLILRGRCPGFLVGFQIFGWTAAAAYTILCAMPEAWDIIEVYFGVVFPPIDALIKRLGLIYDDSSARWFVFETACSSFFLSIPLLAFASVGGYAAHRSKVWLARGAWHPSGVNQPAISA